MKQLTEQVIAWIRDYYRENPHGKAVIGISGGKDSTVCAGLLGKALGYQEGDPISGVVTTNLPSRLRMSMLYAIAAEYPGARVVNTWNRSED